jgi:surface protein
VVAGTDPLLDDGYGINVNSDRPPAVVINWFEPGTNQQTTVYQKYGLIENWDMSQITNLQSFFKDSSSFNSDISKWTLDKVTKLEGMFYGAAAFNIDVSKWNLASATNLVDMFKDATLFTHSLCGNTWVEANADGNVDKSGMFDGAGTGASISSKPCSCVTSEKYLFNDVCSSTCSEGTMVSTTVPEGYTGVTCQVCAAGQWTALTNAPKCTACPLGRYLQDRDLKDPLRHNQLEDCEICDVNAYQDKTGQPRCTQCPSDKPSIDDFENAEKHDSQDDCKPRAAQPVCENGKGRDENDDCTECLPGSVADNENVTSGRETCKLCPIGFFNSQKATEKCSPCAKGSSICAVPGSTLGAKMSTNIPDDYALLISHNKNSNNFAGTPDDAVITNMHTTINTISKDSVEYQQRVLAYVLLTVVATSIIALHRFLPASFRQFDFLFAESHLIDESVSDLYV